MKISRIINSMLLILFSVVLTVACAQKPIIEAVSEKPEQHDPSENYRNRYGLNDLDEKATDNRAQGDERLYGTRNFRLLFHGILYRGGGGNKYISPARANDNPLPEVALKNLCEEGFSEAIYLYSKNYDRSPKTVTCIDLKQRHRTLKYSQHSPRDIQGQKAILRAVHQRILGQSDGPIYSHCWNGWHASGMAAAISLKQFCGWSDERAENYWVKNTDGMESGHESVRKAVRSFKAFPEFQITAEQQKLICPE